MQKTERKKRQGTGVKFIEAKYPALNADVVAVGQRVKLAREALGLSLEEVSKRMGGTGRNKYFLLRIEQGRADPLTWFLARLCEVLGISLRDLYGAPKTELSIDAREFAAMVEEQSAEEPKLMGAVLTILNRKTIF